MIKYFFPEITKIEDFYMKGTNLGILKFETFKAKTAHAKSQIDHWTLKADRIYIHPSNINKLYEIISYKTKNLDGLKLFGMDVNFSMFVCNDDCIVADVSVPVSDRSVVIFKI